MDYKQFRRIQSNRKSFFQDYILKPFIYGAAFGIGYYVAVFIIEHPYAVQLLDFAKDETVKKAALKGLKGVEATATAEQTSQISQAVVKEIVES